MMWLIVIALAAAGWWFFVGFGSSASKAVQAGGYANPLHFDLEDGDSEWRVDFGAMRGWYRYRDRESYSPNVWTEHLIRRVDATRWEMRLADLAWEQQVAELTKDAAAGGLVGPFAAAALKKMGDEPEWEPFPDAFIGMLEVRYQMVLARMR